jgi:histidine ammonia-lyase
LEAARQAVRARIPPLGEDRYLHTDLLRAIELVKSSALIDAVADIQLPSLTEIP